MLRAIEPASIRFNFEVTGFTAFIAAFIVIIAGLLVAAAATTDARKRGELFGAAGLGFMGFIFTAFMGSLMTGAATSPAAERARLTITELKLLSDESAKLRDFERAVEHLKAIEARLSSNDPRRVVIKEQVQALQSKAVQ